MNAEIFPYAAAVGLISALKTAGIDAGITVGGAWIDCNPEQLPQVQAICQEHGGRLVAGYTMAQEETLRRSPNGMAAMERSAKNSAAIMQEWGIEQ